MSTVEPQIAARVLQVLRETFPAKADAITFQSLIKKDLGADSMQLIALMIALDAEFDVEFAADRIPADDVDVAWVAAFVTETVAGSEASRK